MKATIAHRIPGRIRFNTPYKFNYDEINKLKYILESLSGVKNVYIHAPNGSIVVSHDDTNLGAICKKLLNLDVLNIRDIKIEKSNFIYQDRDELFYILRDAFTMRFFMKNFMPPILRFPAILLRSLKFIKKGLLSAKEFRMSVDLLDATAISLSLINGEFSQAASIMFLLNLGEKLEDWTFKKSKADLKRSLSINIDKVFVVEDEIRVLKSLEDVEVGDVVEVTMGNTIPVDGIVLSGIGMVNQASFTGESEPVKKDKGKKVFAGTILEEGKLILKTISKYDDSRISNIIELISESEKNKSLAQKQAENLADSLVKYSFLGFMITYFMTRNFTKAKSFLMVDFSCALKLTIPIAVMRAMRQSSEEGVLVKGGKFLEKLAKADTIVFDKTGTLTAAKPEISKIVTFDDYDRDECLRVAACLEEHFPHSIATAVVEKAKEEGLKHEEMHSEPQYIVAHGIASTIKGKKALIGSEHFIFEDEKINLPTHKKKTIEMLEKEYSLLYLAYDGELIAVLCIKDPIRPDAQDTIKELRNLGFSKIAMLTGDHENSASHVAKALDLDYYKSQVLPEDKAEFIKTEKAKGKTVVMIGDGINDSVALSLADVGISMYKGADIAREISDIAIGSDDLHSLIDVVKIAKELDNRIKIDYRQIISFNGALILLGVFGLLSNTKSAYLHNASTVINVFSNMRPYHIV